ncbi:metallophosphoesterase family protein [Lewinella cohaerens]|uniref:metallophosphoesterase family protein n=1 Tax=Lewinella cohaerens TaxID=70995 RepID=UPI0003702ED5|nr:metallophosphoesterase family protein [Lewinella cohaerens]
MPRKIFISDIHGCLNTLNELLEQLSLKKGDHLILLGDYIDRGPHSKGVIDRVIKLGSAEFTLTTLRGNHEQMLIHDYLSETVKGWKDMADEVLKMSFGIERLEQLSRSYFDFCNELPFYHEEDDFIAVHAGLDFSNENPFHSKENLIWIRDWYKNIDYQWLGQRVIIHGHTPQTRNEIEKQLEELDEKQVLNIDGGAFLAQQKENGLGHLCAFDWTNRKLYFQENIEESSKY